LPWDNSSFSRIQPRPAAFNYIIWATWSRLKQLGAFPPRISEVPVWRHDWASMYNAILLCLFLRGRGRTALRP